MFTVPLGAMFTVALVVVGAGLMFTVVVPEVDDGVILTVELPEGAGLMLTVELPEVGDGLMFTIAPELLGAIVAVVVVAPPIVTVPLGAIVTAAVPE
jgi:hypothetical protein